MKRNEVVSLISLQKNHVGICLFCPRIVRPILLVGRNKGSVILVRYNFIKC